MKEFNYKSIESKSWDAETISYIGLIHEYKGRQQLYLDQEPEKLEKLIEIAKIQSTESSNAIEGIITTNARLKKLMTDKTSPKNRSEKEILGYRHTLNMIHESYEYMPITPNLILQLHKELYSFSTVTYGGKFKDTPNTIEEVHPDGSRFVRFQPLEPWETPQAIEDICNNYNRAIAEGLLDPLILIPVFIHDFLCIHPFNDGNGRMSRLLATLLLYKSGYFVGKYISIEKKINDTKNEYYEALREASDGWLLGKQNETSFVNYMLGITLAAYRDFEDRISIVSKKAPVKEMVMEAVSGIIGRFTKSDVIERCPSISKTSVERALTALVEDGIISRGGVGPGTYYFINNRKPL